MPTARSGDIELFYERLGDPADPPVLLIMGLGAQMIGWPLGFCEALVSRGLEVIRFDNRDVGLSTHVGEDAAYTLWDMADDTAGLLDALGLASAHVVGASMGGMIAQALAITHPERLRSLTSLMSTTGDPSVGGATEEAMRVLLAPPATTREEAIERAVGNSRVIGSPGHDRDEAAVAERAGAAYDRAFDPAGAVRQRDAIVASGDRTARLRELRVPTLVIHGDADPLVACSGGEATAAAIPGAELLVIPGMGHDMPPALWPEIADRIAAHVAAAE